MIAQFGGFSPIHWLVIGLVALLLFGNRLPEVARSVGRAFKEFKRGLRDVSEDLGREDDQEEERPRRKLPGSEPRRMPEPQDQPQQRTTEREATPEPPADRQE